VDDYREFCLSALVRLLAIIAGIAVGIMVAIGGARDAIPAKESGHLVLGMSSLPLADEWNRVSVEHDSGLDSEREEGPPQSASTRLVLGGISADGTPEPRVTAAAVSETVAIPDSNPTTEIGITPAPVQENWNADAIDRFLAGSPLAGLGNVFVAAAAMYGIDPRLMPAVALWESSICRHQAATFNCWGLTSGVDSYGRLIFRGFDNYEDAIWAVSSTYGGYGLPTYAALCMWVSGRANCDSDYPGKVIATMEGIR